MTLAHKILNRHIDEHPFEGLEDEQCKIALSAMEDYAQERAQVLVEALEKIASLFPSVDNAKGMKRLATEALSSYNKKQEDDTQNNKEQN